MKKILLILGFGIAILTSCKKEENDFLTKSGKGDELAEINEETLAELSRDAEGIIFITSQTSARGYEYLSQGPKYDLTGTVRQSLTNGTTIDAGTFGIGSLSFPAQNYNGRIAYASLSDPNFGGYFGTNVNISLATMTSQLFTGVLEFPAELFISAPLSNPSNTPYSNVVTNTDVLTWNLDVKNTHDVLVEITDLSQATSAPLRFTTPDDGSLSFSTLWPYLPVGTFEIVLKRGNWTTFTGNDSRNYRFYVWTSSSVVYSKSGN